MRADCLLAASFTTSEMIDPILFQIGDHLKVTWFGLTLALGFFAAYLTWVFIGRKSGRDSNFAADLLLWIMVSGILGARIAYVCANFDKFVLHPIDVLMINQGGLIYYGGLIGGGVGMYIFARLRKVGFMSLTDFVITGVPVAHFFGRIGCFLNGCCHGSPTEGWPSVVYRFQTQPWYRQVELGLIHRFTRHPLPIHPVQVYESIYNLALFGLMLWLYPRFRSRPGKSLGLYLILYPLGRFCFELLRGDERATFSGVSIAQSVSAVLLLIGIIVFTIASRQNENSSDSIS